MPIENGSPTAFCAADDFIPGHMIQITLGHLHIGIRIQNTEHNLDFIREPAQNRFFRSDFFFYSGNVFQIRNKRRVSCGRELHMIRSQLRRVRIRDCRTQKIERFLIFLNPVTKQFVLIKIFLYSQYDSSSLFPAGIHIGINGADGVLIQLCPLD